MLAIALHGTSLGPPKEKTSIRAGLREPLILTALLLAYGNGLTLLASRRSADPERSFLLANPVLLVALLIYASKRPGGLAALDIGRRKLPTAVHLGVGVGALLSVGPVVFFRRPVLLDTPLEYGPVASMGRREIATDLLLRVPVNVAAMEEVAFRGLLYDSLRSAFSERGAILGSAAAFGGWHIAVTYATTTGQTNIAQAARLPSWLMPFLAPLALLGGLLATIAAGLVFAYLRKRTGTLAAPIAAHWTADALMIYALWRSANRRRATIP